MAGVEYWQASEPVRAISADTECRLLIKQAEVLEEIIGEQPRLPAVPVETLRGF